MSEWWARLLQRLPPIWQYRVLEHGWTAIVIGLFLVLALVFIPLFDVEDHYHDGYHIADMQSAMDISDDDSGYMVHFSITVDGSGPYVLRTSSPALAHTVTQTACVERRMRASGTPSFRLVLPTRCPSSHVSG